MALETFEAGYAGARPPRTGSEWSGMWKLGQITDRIIDGSWPSPWSVIGGNQTKSFSLLWGDSVPHDVQFSADGTKFYILGNATDTIHQYSCSTAWDIGTAYYSSKSFFVGAQESSPYGLVFKSDGTSFYVVGETSDQIYQYSCSTAWDISTASYSNKSFSISSIQDKPTGIFFKSDGTAFYIIGNGSGQVGIYQFTCSTAWDVSTASYANKSIGVSVQESNPQGLFFKDDGTKFYILGSTNDTIYQYSCSTAWDVSTASYDSKSFSVGGQEANPFGLFFKPDGAKFYMIGNGTDTVYQYACSTAWDVSTGSYDNKAFYTSGQESSPLDIQFNNDGTKFYVLGNIADTIYQYFCSTPWDVRTGSYDNKSFNVSQQEANPQGLFFKPDGTKFYIIGTGNDRVYQYSCSTAWDVSTGSYDNKSFLVSTQEGSPQGLFFKPDGTKFYIVGNVTDAVYQYSCSTAWDVSTASYDSKSFSVATQDTNPSGLFFKDDGTKFYVIGSSNDNVYQYSCSTAWDVSTASYDSKSFSVATQDTNPSGLFFKDDGTKFYVIGYTGDSVYQYSCSTAWDVSTASYDSKSFSVATQDGTPNGLFFKSDGTKFYIIGSSNDNVFQYSCSTAWDVSTGSYDNKSYCVFTQETAPTGLFFKDDGTKFYIIGITNDTVYQYACSTAWDVSTGSYDNKFFYISIEGNPNGLFFKPDGTKFYIIGTTADTIYQYSCSTAWDVSTASYDSKSFFVGGQDTLPQGLFFKPDGTKFYVLGSTGDKVYQYSCSTAWDVSTGSYDGKSFDLNPQENSPHGLFFKDDGTKFYVVGSTNDTVYQYTCSTAWDVSTGSYEGIKYSVTAQDTVPNDIFFKSDGTTFYVLGDTNDTIYQYSGLLQ